MSDCTLCGMGAVGDPCVRCGRVYKETPQERSNLELVSLRAIRDCLLRNLREKDAEIDALRLRLAEAENHPRQETSV